MSGLGIRNKNPASLARKYAYPLCDLYKPAIYGNTLFRVLSHSLHNNCV